MEDARYILDKALVRAAFERAAAGYDEAAVLQHEVGQRMLERLALLRLIPQCVLDVGAGTGRGSAALARRYRGARLVALDLAPAMLRRALRRRPWFSKVRAVCGDIERLPIADHSVDLVFSNLTLQWANDIATVFAEWRRVLRPGGAVMFSTFGPDTLRELRASWQAVDGYSHVNIFTDMHDIGDAMLRAGMADPVMDMELFTLTYADMRQLMRDLKAIGAHNVTAGRPRGLLGRRRLQAVADHYEHYRHDGRLPATYEVVYGHAWAPQPAQDASGRSARVTVTLQR